MRNPLYEALCSTLGTYTVSFHTPGHKYKAMHDLALMRIDTTEIDGTDHLHHASGILRDAQCRAAQAYGSLETFFLVGGTTCGIHAMVLSAVPKGKKLLTQRDAHKSVFNACRIGDIPIAVLEPLVDKQLGIPKGIRLSALNRALESDPTIGAVLLTSPNYFGLTIDIGKAAEICHQHGVPLLVDEAHGAHYAFCAGAPVSAVRAGADWVCQSTHKTLPAMTQASMLHVCSTLAPLDRLKAHLDMLQSSSPSYVLMNSLDYAVYFASQHGQRLSLVLNQRLADARKSLHRRIGLQDPQQRFKRYHPDPLRWLIPSEPFKMNGYALEKRLRSQFGIQMELSGEKYVLAIVSLLNSPAEIGALEEALLTIAMDEKDAPSLVFDVPQLREKYLPVLSLSEAHHAEGEWLPLADCAGRIAKEPLVPYPPGVPFVLPGELLTPSRLESIDTMARQQQVDGVDSGKVCVVLENR